MAGFLQNMRNFTRKEDGTMAIEFVIMVPLFVVMITGAVDLSRIYVDQANYFSVARDTARIVARHGMTEDTASQYATARVVEVSSATPNVAIATTATDVTVTISAPIQVLARFGFLDFLNDSRLTATVTHSLEPV